MPLCPKSYIEILGEMLPRRRDLLDQDLAAGATLPAPVAKLEALSGYREYVRNRTIGFMKGAFRHRGVDPDAMGLSDEALLRSREAEQAMLTARLEYASTLQFELGGRQLYFLGDSFCRAASKIADSEEAQSIHIAGYSQVLVSTNRALLSAVFRMNRMAPVLEDDMPLTVSVTENVFEGHRKLTFICFVAGLRTAHLLAKRELLLVPGWTLAECAHTDWDRIDAGNLTPTRRSGSGTGGGDQTAYLLLLKALFARNREGAVSMPVISPVAEARKAAPLAVDPMEANRLSRIVETTSSFDWIELGWDNSAGAVRQIEPSAQGILEALKSLPPDDAAADDPTGTLGGIAHALCRVLNSGDESVIDAISVGLLADSMAVQNLLGAMRHPEIGNALDVRQVCKLPEDALAQLTGLHQSAADRIGEMLAQTGSGASIHYRVSLHPGGAELMVECILKIFSPNAINASGVLWDRINIRCRRTPFAVRALVDIDVAANIEVVRYQPCKIYTATPLYRFHPERMRATRKYSREALAALRDAPATVAITEGHLEALNSSQMPMIEEVNAHVRSNPQRYSSHQSAVTLDELHRIQYLSLFDRSGRKIFDFPPGLCEMFRRTDVDDVPLNMLRFPYPCLYLCFGPQKDLELAPGWCVDGAYVLTDSHGDLCINITAVPASVAQSFEWGFNPEPTYKQIFGHEHTGMTVGHAVDTVLAAKLIELQEDAARPLDVTDAIGEALAGRRGSPLEGERVKLIGGIEIIQDTVATARELQGKIERIHATYREALRLVVNCLCYITAYPEDVAERWPSSAPEKLVKLAQSDRPTEVARAQSKLAALGYTPIHICGIGFKSVERGAASSDPRSGKATHWRRGHWKNQPYGPGNTLRKLQWRMPVLVNLESGDAASAGSLYLVS